MQFLYVTMVVLSLVVQRADFYPAGAPVEACDGLKPIHHGTFPQISASPYSIKVSGSSYTTGGTLQVTLTGGSTNFNGFILSAISNEDKKTPIGEFKQAGIPASGVQLGPCSLGGATTSVTHTGPEDKNNLKFTWTAPTSSNSPDIVFQGAFAQDHDTYWINVFSSDVNFTVPTTTSASTTTMHVTTTSMNITTSKITTTTSNMTTTASNMTTTASNMTTTASNMTTTTSNMTTTTSNMTTSASNMTTSKTMTTPKMTTSASNMTTSNPDIVTTTIMSSTTDGAAVLIPSLALFLTSPLAMIGI